MLMKAALNIIQIILEGQASEDVIQSVFPIWNSRPLDIATVEKRLR